MKESLGDSAAGRELGFNKAEPMSKAGVRSAASFSWAVEPSYLEAVEQIVDEYGTIYRRQEFQAVLDEAPIRFLDSIGREFS